MIMHTHNKGIVLISVLFIVLMLSAIGASMSKTYFLSLKRESFVSFENNAIQYSNNIETLSKQEILKQFRPTRRYTSKSMSLFSDPIRVETENGELIARINDASGCYNINSLVESINKEYIPNTRAILGLKRLFELLDYDDNQVNELIDQMLDWIDKDTQPRSDGLEDYFYTGPMSEVKQYTAERLFYHTSELRNLPASRYIDWTHVDKYLCAYPSTEEFKVNINMLNESHDYLLAALIPTININDARAMIQEIPEDGFTNANELYSSFPDIKFNQTLLPISLTSEVFILETMINNQEFQVNSRTLIEIKNNQANVLSRFYN